MGNGEWGIGNGNYSPFPNPHSLFTVKKFVIRMVNNKFYYPHNMTENQPQKHPHPKQPSIRQSSGAAAAGRGAASSHICIIIT